MSLLVNGLSSSSVYSSSSEAAGPPMVLRGCCGAIALTLRTRFPRLLTLFFVYIPRKKKKNIVFKHTKYRVNVLSRQSQAIEFERSNLITIIFIPACWQRFSGIKKVHAWMHSKHESQLKTRKNSKKEENKGRRLRSWASKEKENQTRSSAGGVHATILLFHNIFFLHSFLTREKLRMTWKGSMIFIQLKAYLVTIRLLFCFVFICLMKNSHRSWHPNWRAVYSTGSNRRGHSFVRRTRRWGLRSNENYYERHGRNRNSSPANCYSFRVSIWNCTKPVPWSWCHSSRLTMSTWAAHLFQ